MAEFKGTDGKWFATNGLEIVSMPSQCKISNSVSGWNYEEALANAKLMSKAPEMLEMLQHVKDYLGSDQREKVEVLIKKATEV